MRRSDQRRDAVFACYQRDVTGRPLDELVAGSRPFTRELAVGVEAHRDELDAIIARHSKGWELDRIAPLERNLMRVALYEIEHSEDVPTEVAIDEAIEIAKEYCGADAPGFVNGVLGRGGEGGRASEPAAGRSPTASRRSPPSSRGARPTTSAPASWPTRPPSSPPRRSRRRTAACARRRPPSDNQVPLFLCPPIRGKGTAEEVSYPEDLRSLVDEELDRLRFSDVAATAGLEEAMRYSLLAGGKRVRPVLALATARAVGADPARFLPVAAAIELIHTYSLIHDDLPAMDDDELRRGLPTSHVKFGEDVAILAGDGLFAEAVRLFCEQPGDPARVLAALRELAAATGVDGMVGGQYVDVVGGEGDAEGLRALHALKTGRLIAATRRRRPRSSRESPNLRQSPCAGSRTSWAFSSRSSTTSST